jgi:hypothetical protein
MLQILLGYKITALRKKRHDNLKSDEDETYESY